MRRIKFFTSFDRIEMQLKYVTLNPFSFRRFLSWIYRYPDVKEILLDTGVDTLFNHRGLKDYPSWYLSEYLKCVYYLDRIIARKFNVEVFAVIPDIPADYPGRKHLYPWNVKRTIEYIQYFLEKVVHRYQNITFIPVVQGAKDSISSVVNTYERYFDLYKKFQLVAVGPTCITRKYKKLAKLILTFDRVTNHEYHVFGPGLATIRIVHDKVKNMRSFDSTAYVKRYTRYKYREYNGLKDALKEFMLKLPPNIEY
ncbi:MAG: hypothetical protein DRO40_12885 [Thermoprotei archaeon]|nr:MAG: hypothetical protein DRO40_12885 [Thermoprotei archaeon]